MILHTRAYKYKRTCKKMHRKGIVRNERIYALPPSLEELKKYQGYYEKALKEAYYHIHDIGGFTLRWHNGYLEISKTFNINCDIYYRMFVGRDLKYESINIKRKIPLHRLKFDNGRSW